MENEQADAGREGRTRLARPILRRERRQGNINFPCSADHEQDWQPLTVDQCSAVYDDHTAEEASVVSLSYAQTNYTKVSQRNTMTSSKSVKQISLSYTERDVTRINC